MESYFEPVHFVIMAGFVVGDVAFVTLPGEVFYQISLNIKKDSPYHDTVTMGLSNDYCGYIPDEKAFLEGGYEPRTGTGSKYEENSQQMIESTASPLLHSLKNE